MESVRGAIATGLIAWTVASGVYCDPVAPGIDPGSMAKKSQKSPAKARAGVCSTARPARMPEIIHPMLATLVDDPFSNPEWIFETKWDGFRSVCFVKKGKSRFVSRNQIDMTPQYPELTAIA